MKRVISFTCLTLLLATWSRPANGEIPSLHFDDVELTDALIQLRAGRGRSADPTAVSLLGKTHSTMLGDYRLTLDFESIEYVDQLAAFSYDFYLDDLSAEERTFGYRVTAFPRGVFGDTVVLVGLRIEDGGKSQEAYVSIPVFCHAPPHFLSVDYEPKFEASLGRRDEHTIHLTNRLENMSVIVTVPEIEFDPEIWKEVRLEPTPVDGRIKIGATGETNLTLTGDPRPVGALVASLPAFIGRSHDEIDFDLSYRTFAGVDRVESLSIPIQFEPSILHLLTVVVLASLVGGFCAWWYRRRWREEEGSIRLLSLAVISATLSWLAAFVTDSSLNVLNFEMDSAAVLPTLMFGFLVGATASIQSDFYARLLGDGCRNGGR